MIRSKATYFQNATTHYLLLRQGRWESTKIFRATSFNDSLSFAKFGMSIQAVRALQHLYEFLLSSNSSSDTFMSPTFESKAPDSSSSKDKQDRRPAQNGVD